MIKKIIIFLFVFSNLNAAEFRLDKVVEGFERPWSITFIDNEKLLITEKPGKIRFINLQNKTIKDIPHNLNILEDGQGGLLDILYQDNSVYVSYSENRLKGTSSTSVAKADLNLEKLILKIFLGQNHR